MFITTHPQIKLMFNYYYNIMKEEAYANQAINWLNQILQENWNLTWDRGQWWEHMTTNLTESIIWYSRNEEIYQ